MVDSAALGKICRLGIIPSRDSSSSPHQSLPSSNRQLTPPALSPQPPQSTCNPRSHDRHSTHQPGNRTQKVPKQHKDPITLYYETHEAPFEEYEEDAEGEGDGAFEFAALEEEEDGFGGADEDY